MIEVLSDEILLIVFRHYLDSSPSFWFRLAHVCQSWRQIIFASTLGLHQRLHLRLYCTYGTPALNNLDCWPPLPLVVKYGGFPTPRRPRLAPKDEDNIMAALEQSDRVYSISLTVTSSLMKKLSAISEPFSGLEELILLSQANVQLALPSTFWWGHRLRTLHSTRIAIPSLPQLLSLSQDLVDIQLHEIPGVGYFSPEAFANALCGMTQLESLSLHFLSFPPRRNHLSLPPPPGDRVVLPALTYFKYRGISKYLDGLVARIDAPSLREIDITFFNQPTLDVSQLCLFINRIEMQSSPLCADIIFSGGVFVTFTRPALNTRLGLQISCGQSDWQLSFISQICDHFSSFLFSVEDLDIKTIGLSSMSDNIDDEQWLGLIRAFDGTKNLRVIGELATDILRALRPADEGHKIVLPALRNLHIQPVFMHESLTGSVASFVTQRQLSSRPVQIHYVHSGDINAPQTRTLSGHLRRPVFSDLMHLMTEHSFDVDVLKRLKQSFIVVLLRLEEEFGCRATEPIQNIVRVLNSTMRDIEEAWRVWRHDHVRAALRSGFASIRARICAGRYQGRSLAAFAEHQSPDPLSGYAGTPSDQPGGAEARPGPVTQADEVSTYYDAHGNLGEHTSLAQPSDAQYSQFTHTSTNAVFEQLSRSASVGAWDYPPPPCPPPQIYQLLQQQQQQPTPNVDAGPPSLSPAVEAAASVAMRFLEAVNRAVNIYLELNAM